MKIVGNERGRTLGVDDIRSRRFRGSAARPFSHRMMEARQSICTAYKQGSMSHEHWLFPCDLSLTIHIHDDGDAYLAIHIGDSAQGATVLPCGLGVACADALHEVTEPVVEPPRPLFSTSEAGNRLRLAFFRRHLARLRSAIADGLPDPKCPHEEGFEPDRSRS